VKGSVVVGKREKRVEKKKEGSEVVEACHVSD